MKIRTHSKGAFAGLSAARKSFAKPAQHTPIEFEQCEYDGKECQRVRNLNAELLRRPTHPADVKTIKALVEERAELLAALERIANIQSGNEQGLAEDADFETVTAKCEEIARAAVAKVKE